MSHVRADRLIVPSLPVMQGNIPAWVCRFLRGLFPGEPGTAAPIRRLYISRANAPWRRVVNEEETVRVLERAGFEQVRLETMSVAEQASTLAAAEAVVAPHGAGLTNLVFCPPGARVIEIFSPAFVNVLYWGLSRLVDLDYQYVMGVPDARRAGAEAWDVQRDIRVDVPKLQRALAAAGLD